VFNNLTKHSGLTAGLDRSSDRLTVNSAALKIVTLFDDSHQLTADTYVEVDGAVDANEL